MRALLDVNVLVALHDRDHVHHAAARTWLGDNIADGWASCPLTQNGFVRVVSQPRYDRAISTSAAIAMLTAATATDHHEFWADEVSVLDPAAVRPDRVLGSKQVTDVYLLALAAQRQGRLVTFDRSIPRSAVPGAKAANLVVI